MMLGCVELAPSAIGHPSHSRPHHKHLKRAGSAAPPRFLIRPPPPPLSTHPLYAKVPFLISALVPISCIAVVLGKRYLNASRELKRLDSVSKSPIYAHFSESVNGVSTM